MGGEIFLMTITHPELVAALCKPGQQIIDEMTPSKAHLLHMAVGVSGEISELIEAIDLWANHDCELNLENTTEELGDLEFFIEAMRVEAGFTREETLHEMQAIKLKEDLPVEHLKSTAGHTIADLATFGGGILDCVKRFAIYNKELDFDRLQTILGQIELLLSMIRQATGITREESLQANIAKLSTRYNKMVFTNEDAQARKDKGL